MDSRQGITPIGIYSQDELKAEDHSKDALRTTPTYVWDERAPVLSGTPTGPTGYSGRGQGSQGDEGGTIYGDKDFS